MATPAAEPSRHRRRGLDLETALLDATWDELVEVGYAKLTMESVASRASTGIAVLRRVTLNVARLLGLVVCGRGAAQRERVQYTNSEGGCWLAHGSQQINDFAQLGASDGLPGVVVVCGSP